MAITEKQRAARSTGLFSSDIPRIMMGDSVSLALEKMGKIETGWRNDPIEVEAGIKVESLILDAYERAVGAPLMERSPDTKRHPEHEWLGSHMDALLSPKRGVEAKSVGEYLIHEWGNPGTAEIPDRVLWQGQTHCAVHDLNSVDVPVCFMNAEALKYLFVGRIPPITIFKIERDYECEEMILKKGQYVWDCIQKGVPPAAEKPSDVRLIYQRDKGGVIEATEEMFETFVALAETKRNLKAAELLEEKWKVILQEYMKDAAELRYQGRTLCTWRNNKGGFRPDLKELEESYPDVYKSVLIPKPGPRVFLVKASKEKK